MQILDWYVLGAALVALVVIFISNLYFLASYAHPKDTPFGSSKIMRFLVVLGFTISYVPIILVLLDVGNAQTGGGFNMQLFWIIQIII
jgi:hypothetical protein